MKITDKEALNIIEKIDDTVLFDTIYDYPEEERDGRTDLEFVADEISWQIYCYNDDSHTGFYDLEDAKQKLRETKNGKIIPLNPETFKPVYGYWKSDIQGARDIVNTYNRMTRALKRLQEKGIYGGWYRV